MLKGRQDEVLVLKIDNIILILAELNDKSSML